MTGPTANKRAEAAPTAPARMMPDLSGSASATYAAAAPLATCAEACVLFEVRARDGVWRLNVDTHNGRTFANWRKWWRDGETLRPTKQGVTFPLARIGELAGVLDGWARANAPYGPENAP